MRLAREIDVRARIIFLVDYVVAVFAVSVMPKTLAGVLALNVLGYVNALAIMVVILVWARVLHKRLQYNLIYDPLTVYHDSKEDMDRNEVATLYGILDKNDNEQVTVETIVRALMVDMHKNLGDTNVAVRRKQEAELVALCKERMAARAVNGDVLPFLHREAFEDNYKDIFYVALAFKIRLNAMKKKRSSSLLGTPRPAELLYVLPCGPKSPYTRAHSQPHVPSTRSQNLASITLFTSL